VQRARVPYNIISTLVQDPTFRPRSQVSRVSRFCRYYDQPTTEKMRVSGKFCRAVCVMGIGSHFSCGVYDFSREEPFFFFMILGMTSLRIPVVNTDTTL